MKLFKLCIHLLLLVVLTSCGTSRTDKTAYLDPDDESGIGGTGILAQESGLGGTGIIGEVTGFGSIFVNGVEVELDNSTRLYVNGKYVKDYNFAVGDVVEIISTKQTGTEFARTIHIRHEVIGPVVQQNKKSGSFKVLGQEVLLNGINMPRRNQYVRVSGFRDQQGRIHARRIEIVKKQTAMISGKLQRNKSGIFHIGKQKLNFSGTQTALAGQYIHAWGEPHNAVFQVQRSQVATTSITRASRHLFIQGFVHKQPGGLFSVANRLIKAPTTTLQQQLSKQAGKLIRLELHREQQNKPWQLNRVVTPASIPRGRLAPPRQHRILREHIPPFRPNMQRRPNMHPGYFMP